MKRTVADANSRLLTRSGLLGRSIGSEVVLALVAALLLFARHRSVFPLFNIPAPAWVQVCSGLALGTVVGGAAAAWLLKGAIFQDARKLIEATLRTASPGSSDFVLIALAAGLGEELLFRGTLQPWIGLWWATAIFTLFHLWVPLQGLARTLYMLFVFSTSVVLGVVFARLGLGAAMAAHASIDLTILLIAQRSLSHHLERS